MTQSPKHRASFFRFFELCVELGLRRSGAVVLALLALLCLSLYGVSQLKFELDLYETYDANFPSTVRLWEMRGAFHDFRQAQLVVSWDQSPAAGELCSLLKKIEQSRNEIVGTRSATTVFDLRQVRSSESEFWFMPLLTHPCDLDLRAESTTLVAPLKSTPFSHYISNSGKWLIIDLVLDDSDTEKFNSETVAQWKTSMKDWAEKENNSALFHLVGPASFRYYFARILQSDAAFNFFILILFIIFFRLFLGTWRSGIYFVVTLFITSIIKFGTLGWLGLPINILANNLFLITAIAGTADFLFISWQQMRGDSFEESFQNMATPGFFTTLTTMIGFASLATSGLQIVTQFGGAAAYGALVEWISTFIFLPALLKSFGATQPFVNKQNSILSFERIAQIRLPRILVYFFILVSALGIPSIAGLKYYEAPIENFPQNHPLRRDFQFVKENLGWEGQLYLQFPRSLDQHTVWACLEQIKQHPAIARVESPFEFQEFAARGTSGLRRDAVLRELETHGYLKKYFSSQTLRASLFLNQSNTDALQSIRTKVMQVCSRDIQIVGQSDVYLEFNGTVSSTLFSSFAMSLFLVAACLWILNRLTVREPFLPILVSILIGPLFMLTVMAAGQVSINLFTSMFLSVLVGMTGDNAIQYMFSRTRDFKQGVSDKAPASIAIGVLLSLASCLFLFQSLIPFRELGALFVLGFLVSLIGDLWVLKGLRKE